MEALFEKYRKLSVKSREVEPEEKILRGAGFDKYFSDLGYKADDDNDLTILIVLCNLGINHHVPFEIERAEWSKWTEKGVKNLEGMKSLLKHWKSACSDATQKPYRDVYNFAFDYFKGEGKTVMPVAETIALWEAFGLHKTWPLADHYIGFILTRKAVNRDLWRMTLLFSQQHRENLDGYNFEEGCWHTVIDEFAEAMKKGEVQKFDRPKVENSVEKPTQTSITTSSDDGSSSSSEEEEEERPKKRIKKSSPPKAKTATKRAAAPKKSRAAARKVAHLQYNVQPFVSDSQLQVGHIIGPNDWEGSGVDVNGEGGLQRGGLAQMVEHSLSMRGAQGSIPCPHFSVLSSFLARNRLFW
ncbi:DCN1-like protein 2 [Planoprotostelium fungivorum]|uniref:Defective in cullin neddylation protein n=1 Tax=Planoprotostelium fungivorum TaxID=1890364 RepID=A0A2P6NB38_9EUKA|nr:DCN1-like protein 2 [Planoprotostelium fungivorum]